MTFVGHLTELRNRIIYCSLFFLFFFILSYFFVENIFSFFTEPLSNIIVNNENKRLIFTGLTEVFISYIKLSILVSIVFSLPFMIYQSWSFIAPGLLKKEKRTIIPFLFLIPLMFIISFFFVYYLIIPIAWEFFIGFNEFIPDQDLKIDLEPKVNEYLSLVLKLIFAFGIAFQLPVIIFLFTQLGIISSETLTKNRRYIVVIVFLTAALITPPDIFSQIGLAIPILFLYELSVFISKFIEKRRK